MSLPCDQPSADGSPSKPPRRGPMLEPGGALGEGRGEASDNLMKSQPSEPPARSQATTSTTATPVEELLPVGGALRPRQAWYASPVLWTAALIVVVGGALSWWTHSLGGSAGIRARYGMAAPLVTIPVHIVVSVSPFPSDVICVGNGILYGFWLGAAISWFGWWIAALLAYGIGRRARVDFDLAERLARLPRWLQRLPVSHPLFLICTRQIPWAGGYLTTVLPGAMGVSFVRHAWCAAIAIIPGAVVMAGIGAGLFGG